MALRIWRKTSCRRCSFWRRIEVLKIGMTASVSTVSTVSVMTSSMSVQPEEEGRGDRGTGRLGDWRTTRTPFLSVSPSLRLPVTNAFINLKRLRLLRHLELARRDARANRAPVGGDEVNFVRVEL